MSKRTKWGILAVIFALSIAVIYQVGQKNEIRQLMKNQRQLIKENQALVATQKDLDKQLRERLTPQASPPADEDVGERKKTEKFIVNLLQDIQYTVLELDSRIVTLERASSADQLENNSLAVDESITRNVTTPQISIEARLAHSQAYQKAVTRHFQGIEQTIRQTADMQSTQTVQHSYEDMINSREDWARDASFKSSECGANYCKVVLNYRNNMDPSAQIEFDTMAYAWISDLPQSRSQYKKNLDGSTDMIIYSAKKGVDLPAFKN